MVSGLILFDWIFVVAVAYSLLVCFSILLVAVYGFEERWEDCNEAIISLPELEDLW